MSYDSEVQTDQPLFYYKMVQTTGGTPGSVTETNYAFANGWTGAVNVNGTYDSGYYTGTTKLTISATNAANVGILLNRASLVATQSGDKSVYFSNNGLSPTRYWNTSREGSGGYLAAADNAAWDVTAFTAECWFKSNVDVRSTYGGSTTIHRQAQYLISRRNPTLSTSSWALFVTPNGAIQTNIWGAVDGTSGVVTAISAVTGSPANWNTAAGNYSDATYVDPAQDAEATDPNYYSTYPLRAINVLDGQPHHIVTTFSTTTKELRIYVDGQQRGYYQTYDSAYFTPTMVTADAIYVGSYIPATSSQLGVIGYIGNVAFYNKALTAERIAAHYYAGAGYGAWFDLAWEAVGVKQNTLTEGVSLSQTYQLIDSVAMAEGVSLTANQIDTVPLVIVVTDSVTMSDLSAGGSSYENVVSQTISMSESVIALREALGVITDTVTFDGVQAMTQAMINSINDGFIIGIGAIISGEQYIGWVMNANTYAVSRYMQYPFNSFAESQGVQLGATEDGIYELTGDTDDGAQIDAAVLTGRDDFGDSVMKRMLKAYLGLSTDGRMYMTTIANENERRTYELNVNNTTVREAKIDLGRGVKSRYWQFEITNVAGSDFELEAVEWFPVMLTRRV